MVPTILKGYYKGLVIIVVFILLFNFSCNDRKQQEFSVRHFGELRNIMKKNDLSTHLDFSEFEPKNNLYALGALESLKGELLVLDGKPYRIFLEQGRVKIENDFDFKAVIAVTSNVSSWKTYDIPDSVNTKKELELFILLKAKAEGIDVASPFPFMIEGKPSSISWHVIDWPATDSIHSHEKHVKSGPNGQIENKEASILCFYSNKHQGVFTHHTTNVHMHFMLKDESLGGHLDNLFIGKNMKLKLPL
jgi:acetolactate decarboxylase